MTGVSERGISMTVLAALCAAGVLGGTAHADSGLVVTVGIASERERAVVAETFSQAATNIGWTLSGKRPSAKESEALAACKSATLQCVPASVQSSGVDLVLVVTVNPAQNEGTPSLELVGRAFLTKLQTSTAEKRYCDNCTEEKLKATSVELAEIVLHRLATQSTDTWVKITSDPPGAQILLDNGREPIGVTDGTFRTFHGTHNVILQKPGYATVEKGFTVKKGETAHLSVPLTATATETPPSPSHPTRRSRVLPGVLVGTGVLAIAGAAILYHYDEDPGPRVGDTYTDTAPAALGLGIGGVIAVGAGVGYYLWRARSGPSSVPSAAIVPGGAVLGWSGSF
jgi:hypothetical protein